jgi:hypothetical protein
MSWVWRFLDAAGKQLTPHDVDSPAFSAQGDAETWIGESWRELADAGVSAVVLVHDGHDVYGPMSLAEPEPED